MKARRLVRRYGALRALDGLDLEVPQGAFFGLLGANGAGKSTALRVLTGLIPADEGEASLLGNPVRAGSPDIAGLVGLVPDFPVLYDVLTIRENVDHVSRLRGLAPDDARARLDEIALSLALDGHLDVPYASLSQGSRKKAALALALLHAPPLLFLDEPFEGVDPIAARTMRSLLDTLRRRGVTVFVTSHVLPLVESIATHAAVIDEGRCLVSGPLEDVRAGFPDLESAVLARLGRAPVSPELDWYAT